jgi:hypothetical protein
LEQPNPFRNLFKVNVEYKSKKKPIKTKKSEKKKEPKKDINKLKQLYQLNSTKESKTKTLGKLKRITEKDQKRTLPY